MRVSTKMTLALTAAGVTLFGGHGLYQLQTETDDLRSASARQLELLGRSLQVSLENALRDRQLADIQETLEALERIDPDVEIVVFDVNGQLRASSDAMTIEPSTHEAGKRAAAANGTVLEWLPQEAPSRLVLGLPLRTDSGEVIGGMVVERPLAELRADVRDTRDSIVLSIAIFSLAAGLLGLLFGELYITRPLWRIVREMRALRVSGRTSVLPVRGESEVDSVAAEFNDLAAALQNAQTTLASEIESRQRLERDMQSLDKLITIGQLSAGLAHEIGSPLQILQGRANALATKAHDVESVRKNAGILVEQVGRITRIVEQLLHFARRHPRELRRVDIVPLVRAVVDLVIDDARKRRIELNLTHSHEQIVLEADGDQLQQVVLNLVTNAMAAMPEGGRLSVEVTQGRVHLTSGLGEVDGARLIVTDSGMGMSPDVADRVFEPFFTTRGREGGTGLGLAVVKTIVAEHRGSISVTSQPDLGSRFTVELPATRCLAHAVELAS
jgi:signal transduction histidine kinase